MPPGTLSVFSAPLWFNHALFRRLLSGWKLTSSVHNPCVALNLIQGPYLFVSVLSENMDPESSSG